MSAVLKNIICGFSKSYWFKITRPYSSRYIGSSGSSSIFFSSLAPFYPFFCSSFYVALLSLFLRFPVYTGIGLLSFRLIYFWSSLSSTKSESTHDAAIYSSVIFIFLILLQLRNKLKSIYPLLFDLIFSLKKSSLDKFKSPR